ncbi:MAG: hypothetical protein ACR2PQ_10710 [Myxococcota bacterium]
MSARFGAAWLSFLVAQLLGCALLTSRMDDVPPVVQPEPEYEELFPYYVELCAVTQYRSLEYGDGGAPGHAVMYLKGACKDETASHPRLRACRRAAVDRLDPEHGVGISVNRYILNANWIAIPGAPLFWNGGLEEDETLDQAAFERAVQESIDVGVFAGVEIDPAYPTEAAERSLEDFVARQSIATDFALAFSRTSFCSRLPVTEEMMEDIADYLNFVNEDYASGRIEYVWSGYSDNCAHLLRNSLAAASVWQPRSVQTSRFRQLGNLSVPANEVIELADLMVNGPLDDGRDVYRTDEARDALLDFDWLPRRHGALVTVVPVHAPNHLYDTHGRILILESPFSYGATRKFNRILFDPRYTELRPNLEYFRDVYAGLLAEGEALIAGGFLPLRSLRYLRFTKRYFEYVAAQSGEIDAMLERIAE